MRQTVTLTLNPALDLSTEAPAVVPDHKLRCGVPREQPGGGGVNVSRALAHLGGTSRALVVAGGPAGDALLAAMKAEGLQPHALPSPQETRRSLAVTDQSSGAQYRFLLPGPDWSEAEAETLRAPICAALTPGDVLVISGSLPPGVAPDYPLTIAPTGVDVILDTSGPALHHAAKSTGLHSLRMDHDEAEALFGTPITSVPEAAAACTRLRAAAQHGLIALGAQGTVISGPTGTWHCQPPKVPVVSKVGAGDSFVAGYTLATAQGASPEDACRMGTAAAAAAVMTPDSDLCDGSSTQTLAANVTCTRLDP